MLANDARILIRSAVATAIAGVILIVVSAILDGGQGALGAGLAVVLVTVFFTLSVVAVSLAGRLGPAAMMASAFGTYFVKIIAVVAIVVAFRDTTVFSTKLFGVTAIICILVWSAGQVATLARRRVPYVVPDARASGAMPEARRLNAQAEAGQKKAAPRAGKQ